MNLAAGGYQYGAGAHIILWRGSLCMQRARPPRCDACCNCNWPAGNREQIKCDCPCPCYLSQSATNFLFSFPSRPRCTSTSPSTVLTLAYLCCAIHHFLFFCLTLPWSLAADCIHLLPCLLLLLAAWFRYEHCCFTDLPEPEPTLSCGSPSTTASE